jgi:hypothetical protein
MSTYAKMRTRRNNWRRKTGELRAQLHYQLRENRRVKQERDQYKRDWRSSQQALKALQKNRTLQPIQDKAGLVFIALQLFLVARIGFRAVSRVLAVMASQLGLTKPPCAQTIINWVTRLSLARMRDVAPSTPSPARFPHGYVLLLDSSIGLGQGKILTLLALDPHHHGTQQSAPALNHLRCLAVAVADTWNGETIAALLREVIARFGAPIAYLKDGGTDLAKAVRVLNTPDGACVSIDDLSHYAANLLKHAFEGHPRYPIFLQACGAVSKRLKQTVLACLAPPKVSTKARFMNLHRLVSWAERLLEQSPRGRATKGSLLQKLRDAFDSLPRCKGFINDYLANAKPILECQSLLKKRGLNHTTYDECQRRVATIPLASIRIPLSMWLDNHLAIARALGLQTMGLPISSDGIESLFGVGKHLGTGQIKDANRIALRIPALCGELTRADAEAVLRVTVKEQNEAVGSLPSLIKQRRDVFSKGEGLDSITNHAARPSLRLVPGSKSPQKISLPIDNTENIVIGPDPFPNPA